MDNQVYEIQYSIKKEIPLRQVSIYPSQKKKYLDYNYIITNGDYGKRVAVINSSLITNRLLVVITEQLNRAKMPYITI